MTERNTEEIPEQNVESTEESLLNTPLEDEAKDDEKPTEEAEEESEEEGAQDDEVSEDENQDEAEKPKKKVSGFKRRLNRERDRAEAAERRAYEAEQRLKDAGKPQQEAQEQGEQGPDPKKYDHGINDINYINDMADHRGRTAAREEFAKLEQARQTTKKQTATQNRIKTVEEKYLSTMDDAAESHNDFDEVISSVSDPNIDPNVAFAIKDSDVGGEIFYHLAKNPKVLKKLKGMSSVQAVKEVGKMEAKLTEKPEPKKKPVSKMSKPLKPLGTGKTNAKSSYSNDMSQEEFNRSFPLEDLM